MEVHEPGRRTASLTPATQKRMSLPCPCWAHRTLLVQVWGTTQQICIHLSSLAYNTHSRTSQCWMSINGNHSFNGIIRSYIICMLELSWPQLAVYWLRAWSSTHLVVVVCNVHCKPSTQIAC